ncbi:hypothetical protein KC19_2G235000 [Ceratodon purpureus]|uniref:Chromo domain-containing protein n=1 Tax=Ceratodon purpureus TaxID=3225 RepID=A0A8T0IZL4_CERPU|nr:hypothetical protein KC19_2G235000 [Ceratodon purpureus]
MVQTENPWQKKVRLSEVEKSKEERLFEVEKVIGHREVSKGSKTSAEYLVLWLDYPIEDATWEPWRNLKSCEQLVHDYHNRVSRMLARHYPQRPPTQHRMDLRGGSKRGNNKGVGDEAREEEEWEIEAILGHEMIEHANDGKKMHFLVKWKGNDKAFMMKEKIIKEYDHEGILIMYMAEHDIVFEEEQASRKLGDVLLM